MRTSNATIIDNLQSLTTSMLRDNGYLRPGQNLAGAITFFSNGREVGSISFGVNTENEKWCMRVLFTLTATGETVHQFIPLVWRPSNLGRGKIWYFQCPRTGKTCRKLYLIAGRFQHRTALQDGMYESQTRSKYERLWGGVFTADDISEKIHAKHFKRFYRGKPTKRYKNLLRRLEIADRPLF